MNWIELKALNMLYTIGEIKVNETLKASAEITFLADTIGILETSVNKIKAETGFKELYEEKYLSNFVKYQRFLTELNLLKPQTRLEEKDINILMHIQHLKDEGTLEILRLQIISYDESLKGVSQMFFKNEKYLLDKPSLIHALKIILDIDHFSIEKDQQYIYKLECHNPMSIVLCENLDQLTKPNKPRQNRIELWYAGGKNINKLEYSDTRGLPIYYSCDWDYDGLFIIYPLVKNIFPQIQLLTPNGKPKSIKDSDHDSLWSGKVLNSEKLFEKPAHIDLVHDLVNKDQWIIEESNNLMVMIEQHI